MFKTKKKIVELEKRIADLEAQVQGQQQNALLRISSIRDSYNLIDKDHQVR